MGSLQIRLELGKSLQKKLGNLVPRWETGNLDEWFRVIHHKSPDFIVIYGDLWWFMVIDSEFIVIYGDLCWFYSEFIVIYCDWWWIYRLFMVICGELWVIYGSVICDELWVWMDLMIWYLAVSENGVFHEMVMKYTGFRGTVFSKPTIFKWRFLGIDLIDSGIRHDLYISGWSFSVGHSNHHYYGGCTMIGEPCSHYRYCFQWIMVPLNVHMSMGMYQDPKMEVRSYHISGHSLWWYSLTNRPDIYRPFFYGIGSSILGSRYIPVIGGMHPIFKAWVLWTPKFRICKCSRISSSFHLGWFHLWISWEPLRKSVCWFYFLPQKWDGLMSLSF